MLRSALIPKSSGGGSRERWAAGRGTAQNAECVGTEGGPHWGQGWHSLLELFKVSEKESKGHNNTTGCQHVLAVPTKHVLSHFSDILGKLGARGVLAYIWSQKRSQVQKTIDTQGLPAFLTVLGSNFWWHCSLHPSGGFTGPPAFINHLRLSTHWVM